MGLGSVLPGPNRLLLVLPDERLVEKALRSDVAVWVVTDAHRHSADWLRDARRRTELVLVDARDGPNVTEVAEETARQHGIAHVLPATYGGSGQAARLLSDTTAMRRLLAHNGRPVVRSRAVSSVAEAEAAVRWFGFPAAVRSAAGRLVLADEAALRHWAGTGPPGPWLVEEAPAGRELLASTLTVDGMHHLVGITERTRDGDYLHPAELARRDAAAVAATVTGLLDLAGHEFGPAETEVVLTAHGPRVVASGAWFSRHRLPRLIELASGFDPEEGLLRALAGEPLTPPHAVRTAGLGWLPPGALPPTLRDRITELPGVAQLDAPGPGPGSSARPGFVLVRGTDVNQVRARIATVRKALRERS